MGRSNSNKSKSGNRLIVSCVCCGHVIGRVADAHDVETTCPRCGGKMVYSASIEKFEATIIKPPKSWKRIAV